MSMTRILVNNRDDYLHGHLPAGRQVLCGQNKIINKHMKLLFIGATGMLGKPVAKELIQLIQPAKR